MRDLIFEPKIEVLSTKMRSLIGLRCGTASPLAVIGFSGLYERGAVATGRKGLTPAIRRVWHEGRLW
ncbi:hypothetical protein LX81_04322 [Palleronia aestuarii]|uniref:Uncharacterized protein n=1 Tax=Palleronia aestuarii TaxID=568105 RepID=A0A2W7MPH4_9RHOB|nr:hypothetical protein LX81_04322 [Palleronia aestuarii]